jgi:AAA+ ATPase superfamily predicted ATPase
MHFVGRKREISKIIKTIERGANVIIQGKYGIGRTSLIRHVARIKKDVWHFMFVDFSDSSGKMCRKLLRELLPEKKLTQDRIFTRFKPQNFKTSLFLIANDSFKDRRKHIIVLDNVAKTTRQKLTFIRNLAWTKRFQFVAIIEPFLPAKELLLFRAELIPADVIHLSYLQIKEACEFFKIVARKNSFDWSEKYIRMLAKTSNGYPLGMMELIK